MKSLIGIVLILLLLLFVGAPGIVLAIVLPLALRKKRQK